MTKFEKPTIIEFFGIFNMSRFLKHVVSCMLGVQSLILAVRSMFMYLIPPINVPPINFKQKTGENLNILQKKNSASFVPRKILLHVREGGKWPEYFPLLGVCYHLNRTFVHI